MGGLAFTRGDGTVQWPTCTSSSAARIAAEASSGGPARISADCYPHGCCRRPCWSSWADCAGARECQALGEKGQKGEKGQVGEVRVQESLEGFEKEEGEGMLLTSDRPHANAGSEHPTKPVYRSLIKFSSANWL